MGTIVRRNERSWAIELITHINSFVNNKDLKIKRAGGESTVSIQRGSSMFPDVILYGNTEQSIILQGWELKMPDVPIEDETFIKDAQRKAVALNLNSCLIWNFTYAVLYVRQEGDTFKKVKQWTDTCHIKNRDDVNTYRHDWESLLEKVLLEINELFVSGEFRQSTIGDVISNTTLATIIDRNKVLIANEIKTKAFGNSVISAYIDNWWSEISSEYEHDETDKYNAYAKTVILNWTNRIVFAHIIKTKQNGARLVDEIKEETTPNKANEIFKKITEKCDFYNVFGELKFNELIPEVSWKDFLELSLFLKSNGIDQLDQTALQNIMENSVNATKRTINGQFTTPEKLAEILVRLTVIDWNEPFIDCCCGTGTIPKMAIKRKKLLLSPKEAVESVWASDKNNYPLQVANISMTESDTINVANRLFRHNALDLKIGEIISITDPTTGEELKLALPEFGSAASNLPFVEFERIPNDDKAHFSKIKGVDELDGRSDLYCYIALKVADILKEKGRFGIITSNSWLGTSAGQKFYNAIKKVYNLKQVHISGKGRWFSNADIVTTIIVLEKKSDQPNLGCDFYLWKASLKELTNNAEKEEKLINSALLGQEIDSTVVERAEYSTAQLSRLGKYGISLNALFHKVGWLDSVFDKLVQIKDVYNVFRGSRRGWDAMFYPAPGEHHIEPIFLENVLINARNIDRLDAKAESDAFCCSLSMEELRISAYAGAISWIEKFKDQRNGVGKPLPEVLKRSNMFWYEMKKTELAEVFTMMNPDQRLFFARFEEPSFVNQRLIGLTHKGDYPDQNLNHALLNSIITLFYIEASGFGRGLGVLDINKNSISNCYMPNPKLISKEDREEIIKKFAVIRNRDIKNIREELKENDRLEFEKAVLHSLGIEDKLDEIVTSLVSMQETRGTARSNV